jgi:hypothetical protein
MTGNSDHCGDCLFMVFKVGNCRPYCKIRGRQLTDKEFNAACKYWADRYKKELQKKRTGVTREKRFCENLPET